MELNIRQQNVVNSTEKNILCLAGPGAGKTHTLVARINKLLENGVNPSKIVCFSFTNYAADEMKNRLVSIGKDIYIGTIHSYANSICAKNGIKTSIDIEQEKFDEIIRKASLINPKFYPQIDYLFVDEFQDINTLQYNFIRRLKAKNNYFCGDERQAIYSFIGSSDKYIFDMAADPMFKKFFLVDDYRNPENILDFANDFVSNIPKISPPSKSALKDATAYINSSCAFSTAIEEMTWTTNWKDWAVLCRTNKEIEAAADMLQRSELPYIIVRKSDLDLCEFNKQLASNKIKIMTIHASKGNEFNHVVSIGAKTYAPEERRIAYVSASRAKQSLYWCPSLKIKTKSKQSGSYSGQIITF